MTSRSEAAKRGWDTRRDNEARARGERFYVRPYHIAEAEAHWALMSPPTRATAIERGWGADLPAEVVERFRQEAKAE